MYAETKIQMDDGKDEECQRDVDEQNQKMRQNEGHLVRMLFHLFITSFVNRPRRVVTLCVSHSRHPRRIVSPVPLSSIVSCISCWDHQH